VLTDTLVFEGRGCGAGFSDSSACGLLVDLAVTDAMRFEPKAANIRIE